MKLRSISDLSINNNTLPEQKQNDISLKTTITVVQINIRLTILVFLRGLPFVSIRRSVSHLFTHVSIAVLPLRTMLSVRAESFRKICRILLLGFFLSQAVSFV